MKKLKVVVTMIALSVGLVFSGCSGDKSESTKKQEQEIVGKKEDSKEKEETKKIAPMTVDFKTKVYENDKFSIEIPENWTADDKSNPTAIVQIYDKEKITPDFSPNIALTDGTNMPEDMNKLKEEMEKDIANQKNRGMKIVSSEIMDRSFGQIFYVRVKTSLTEDDLKYWLKEGGITEAQIKQAGGNDAVIKKMNTEQLQIYVTKDGVGVIIGATFDDSCFEEMKETALYVAETLKVK